MTNQCPKCKKGMLYARLEKDSGILTKTCYACGYYWDNSEGYKVYPKLTRSLFKKYFGSQIATPFATPEDNTHQGNTTRVLVVFHLGVFRKGCSGRVVSSSIKHSRWHDENSFPDRNFYHLSALHSCEIGGYVQTYYL